MVKIAFLDCNKRREFVSESEQALGGCTFLCLSTNSNLRFEKSPLLTSKSLFLRTLAQ